jgi:hypothetical protein
MKSGIIVVVLLLFLSANAPAQPRAGDVYREYSQHVGGRNWRVTDPNVQNARAKKNLPNPVLTVHIGDLDKAIRAEALIDRWGGHTKTYDHKIRFNKNSWIDIPGLQTTPSGHESEMYHYQDNPIVEIPLNHLKEVKALPEWMSWVLIAVSMSTEMVFIMSIIEITINQNVGNQPLLIIILVLRLDFPIESYGTVVGYRIRWKRV